MRAVLPLLLCVSLTGCAAVSPEASAIRIVNSERALDGCKYVESVRGDQNLYGGALFARAAYEDALNQMKAQTAAAGANTLYVSAAGTGMIGANARGDAYRC